jgi:tripartite ATP-independent transporter DctP family solute receptor
MVLDNEGGQMIADLAEPKGFKVLSWWDWGFRQITNSKHPINTPEDVKGLKFRIAPEISMEAAFHAMGAITAKISFSELYMALAQGVVDGQDNGIAASYHMKFYEQNKHFAIVNYMYQPAIHMISTATWAKLTPEQQKLFMTASAECRDYMRKLMNEEESSLIPKMEAAGVQFTYPDAAVFQAVMQPAMIKIADFTGHDFSKKFLGVTKKYAKKDSMKAYLQKTSEAF